MSEAESATRIAKVRKDYPQISQITQILAWDLRLPTPASRNSQLVTRNSQQPSEVRFDPQLAQTPAKRGLEPKPVTGSSVHDVPLYA